VRRVLIWTVVAVVLAASFVACGSDDSEEASDPTTTPTTSSTSTSSSSTSSTASSSAGGDSETLFPDVLAATARQDGDGTWTFDATLSSPYDSPERYADAWRVVGPDGTVYGLRDLAHDHANEQPFTRSQSGIEIPDEVNVVTVEGRDQLSGWGGATVEVELG